MGIHQPLEELHGLCVITFLFVFVVAAFHACVVCKQKFISYIALVRHKSVEHGIKPGKPKKVKEPSKSGRHK